MQTQAFIIQPCTKVQATRNAPKARQLLKITDHKGNAVAVRAPRQPWINLQ